MSEFAYEILADDSVTELAVRCNLFRQGEGGAIILKFSESLSSITARRGDDSTLTGIIHCTCGKSFPFETSYQFSCGGPKGCPACGKQTHVGTHSGSRAPGTKENELMVTLITNDRRLTQLTITGVAGGEIR